MEDVFGGVDYNIFRRKSQKSRKTAPIETAPKWEQKIYARLVVGKIQIQSFFSGDIMRNDYYVDEMWSDES